ncbi:MAG: VTT domain-containing protein [Acutalibacteraceae bacterium]
MDFLLTVWDYVLHLDKYLEQLIGFGGIWVYVIMALVVFAETAFVVTVFLPSDTILFAACALSAVNNSLNFPVMLIIFLLAAALGDSMNFLFGRKLRGYVQRHEKLLFLKKENLQKADSYYRQNGNITLIFARFVPVLRSLAPFVAGMSDRSYKKFLMYNLIGVAIWTLFFCLLGFFFGSTPFVKKYYALIVLCIGLMSLITAAISAIITRLMNKSKSAS